MIIKISMENMLGENLTELGLLPPCYQSENTEDIFTSKLCSFYHDNDGSKCITDRIGVSSVGFEEAKFITLVSVIDASKAVYSFEVQDYNYRDLTILRDSYGQVSTDLQSKYTESHNQVQACKVPLLPCLLN